MNVIIVTGYATKDVTLKYSPNGKAISNGTIAVRRDYKNQHGEYETDFFNFVAIGKLSEIMANNIRKGDKFGLKGKLQNRVWEKDNGDKVYFTEIFVDGFDFPVKGNTPKTENKRNTEQSEKPSDPFGGTTINISDDDMPF